MTSESIELAGRRIAQNLIPAAKIAGDDKEDTRLLKQMAKDTKAYILSFAWCKGIHETYFGCPDAPICRHSRQNQSRQGRQIVAPYVREVSKRTER